MSTGPQGLCLFTAGHRMPYLERARVFSVSPAIYKLNRGRITTRLNFGDYIVVQGIAIRCRVFMISEGIEYTTEKKLFTKCNDLLFNF
jgi:hypothetical protein